MNFSTKTITTTNKQMNSPKTFLDLTMKMKPIMKNRNSSSCTYLPATDALEQAITKLNQAPFQCKLQKTKKTQSGCLNSNNTFVLPKSIWQTSRIYDTTEIGIETDRVSLSLDFPIIEWSFSNDEHDDTVPSKLSSFYQLYSKYQDEDIEPNSDDDSLREIDERCRSGSKRKASSSYCDRPRKTLCRSTAFRSKLALLNMAS